MTENQLQEKCRQFVDHEVLVCLSTLVDEFKQRDFEGFYDAYPDLVSGYIENEDGDEEYIEIYEYWAVSGWLAQKLQKQGERVDMDFYGLCIWGRTCTGQAILLDAVICSIVQGLE